MQMDGCEYVVMEVSSQALSQNRVYGIDFSASAITNITPEHLDYHECMENYTEAKLQLFKSSEFACVNIDDSTIEKNLDRISCKKITYSALSDKADYTAKNIICNEKGIQYEFVGLDCISRIKSDLFGRFTVYNTLCAISILLNLGFDMEKISQAVSTLTPIKGRAEIVKIPRNYTVMICLLSAMIH